MATTGVEIQKIIEQKVDKSYTGFYDTAKMNRLLKGILYKVIDQKIAFYRQTQKIAEEISPLVVYGKQVTVTLARIPTKSLVVKNITYVGSIVTVTVDSTLSFMQPGDSVVFENAPLGISGIIATPVVTTALINQFTFNNGSVPTGTYTPNTATVYNSRFIPDLYRLLGGNVRFPGSTTLYSLVGPVNINTIGKVFGQPSTRFPRFEMSDNSIIIEPISSNCNFAELFYCKNPKEFDVTNNVYDYEKFWSFKMIDHITDIAAKLWMGYIKDVDGFKIEDAIIIDNP